MLPEHRSIMDTNKESKLLFTKCNDLIIEIAKFLGLKDLLCLRLCSDSISTVIKIEKISQCYKFISCNYVCVKSSIKHNISNYSFRYLDRITRHDRKNQFSSDVSWFTIDSFGYLPIHTIKYSYDVVYYPSYDEDMDDDEYNSENNYEDYENEYCENNYEDYVNEYCENSDQCNYCIKWCGHLTCDVGYPCDVEEYPEDFVPLNVDENYSENYDDYLV